MDAMAFTPITVVGTFEDASGKPATGRVTATPSHVFTNGEDAVTTKPIVGTIVGGKLSFKLMASNDPETIPVEAFYTFRLETFTGGPPTIFKAVVPYTAPGREIDWTTLARNAREFNVAGSVTVPPPIQGPPGVPGTPGAPGILFSKSYNTEPQKAPEVIGLMPTPDRVVVHLSAPGVILLSFSTNISQITAEQEAKSEGLFNIGLFVNGTLMFTEDGEVALEERARASTTLQVIFFRRLESNADPFGRERPLRDNGLLGSFWCPEAGEYVFEAKYANPDQTLTFSNRILVVGVV